MLPLVASSDTKTVFVILRTGKLLLPSEDTFSFDRSTKTVDSCVGNKVLIQKSLWTCVVEAILEYCRITFDLFFSTKPISLITVDSEERIHSVWYEEDQTLDSVWNVFTNEGTSLAKLENYSPDMVPGLQSCKSVLSLPTPLQATGAIKGNSGRVILIGTDLRENISQWFPIIQNSLRKPANDDERCLPIDSSEWIFVDVASASSFNDESLSNFCDQISMLSDPRHRPCYYRFCAYDRGIYSGLMLLAERNLNLASTLVQDIPMKEEANVSSGSSMYGVELIHDSKAHDFLRELGLAEDLYVHCTSSDATLNRAQDMCESGQSYQRPPSGFSRTLGINWVTPRSSDNLMIRHSIAAFRVTMAAAGNRASVCLAQFVLGGRSVVLACRHPSYKTACNKSTSDGETNSSDQCYYENPPGEAFLLLCHGSVMYLHVLASVAPLSHPPVLPLFGAFSRSPPSPDSEKYRLSSFVKKFLYPARLAPASARLMYSLTPKDRALQHVERSTRYWPLREDTTVLGTNSLADPLFEHLPKYFLENSEYSACEQSIKLLLEFIRAHPVLKECTANLVQTQPVAMALELANLMEACSDISEEHAELNEILERFLNSTPLSVGNCNVQLGNLINTAKNILLNHVRKFDDLDSPTSALLQLNYLGRCLVKMCPPPVKQTLQDNTLILPHQPSHVKVKASTIDEFLKNLNKASRKPPPTRAEFAGVLGGNGKDTVRLYAGLSEES